MFLRDMMKQTTTAQSPPRLAACNWDCFSTRQTLVSAFFTKGSLKANVTQVLPSSEAHESSSQASVTDVDIDEDVAIDHDFWSRAPKEPTLSQESTIFSLNISPAPSQSTPKPDQGKRTPLRNKKPSQTKLSGFFKQLQASASQSSSVVAPSPASSTPREVSSGNRQIDADYEYALLLAEADEAGDHAPKNNVKSKSAWSTLLAPVKPPNCDVHGEPAMRRTTTKPGPNKGKGFYICSRPLGPGWDAGKGKRLREEVDVRYKCDFFRWESDVKRQALRSGSSDGDASSLRPAKKSRLSPDGG